jgi:SMC interacting uncharacterized protein involved in chromosome segregation
MATSTQSRQSKAGISKRHVSPRQRDTRPLQDKAWQKKVKERVIHFLAEHRYPAEVSPKKLSGPTQKEFFGIVGFILRVVEPSTPKDLGNNAESMDYVITFLKARRYAFPPAKSALQAVSSPVYWPTILGMLDWLVTYAISHVHGADLNPAVPRVRLSKGRARLRIDWHHRSLECLQQTNAP